VALKDPAPSRVKGSLSGGARPWLVGVDAVSWRTHAAAYPEDRLMGVEGMGFFPQFSSPPFG
jgi:hypothetical protein